MLLHALHFSVNDNLISILLAQVLGIANVAYWLSSGYGSMVLHWHVLLSSIASVGFL